jgi:4,5-dihydroxyphthalate decarboxylase
MGELPLLMACEAPTFQALYDGTVGFDGIDLKVVKVAPAERHRRMLQQLEFDICEYSSGNYLNGLPLGQPFTALPVFPLRQFRHRDIWIWQGAGIQAPADLNGKRIGIGNWANSAALWERGLLVQDHGLDVASVDWVAGAPEDPRFAPPPWLRSPPGSWTRCSSPTTRHSRRTHRWRGSFRSTWRPSKTTSSVRTPSQRCIPW